MSDIIQFLLMLVGPAFVGGLVSLRLLDVMHKKWDDK